LLAWILAALPLTVNAQQLDNSLKGSVSVTLVSQDGEKVLEGAVLSVFYVATVEADENGILRYTYTDVFAECGTALDDPELIAALDVFVAGKDLASRKMVTDSMGNAVCEDLPLGLYFVQQSRAVEGFAPCAPFLVTVPIQTEAGFDYDVDASPKTDVERLVSISIKKVWNTDKSTVTPGSVTVHLLRNEEVVETATLNTQNNWQIIYKDLPESDGYSIKEVNIPKGFTATYAQKEYTFTVTNTASLAQTGQLLWPIPVLAVTGLFLLLTGAAILGRVGKHNG
jgi:uncharacterized surface anchored protein